MSTTAGARPRVALSAGTFALEWLVTIAYAAYVSFMIPFHEPWADQAQAWQMARSLSITELFHTYLRYEGTPGLWHLLLAFLARMHVSYTGIHWFSAAIGAAATALLVFCSPFPRYVRLALPFTFFLAFQYAVIARSYVLVPTLLFLTAIVWRRSPVLVALCLGLLGNVSLHALAISGGFALVYVIENWRSKKSETRFVAAVLLAFYGLAVWTVLPRPPDLNFDPWRSWSEYGRWFQLLLLSFKVIYPLIILVASLSCVLLSIPCWIYVIVRFLRAGLWLYSLPVLVFIAFSFYYCNYWHAGLLVPTFIAICWITWPRVTSMGRGAGALVIVAILFQIGCTIYATRFDISHDYSPGLATARYLAPRLASGDEVALTYINDPRVGAFHSIAIAPYFAQPVFLNQNRPFWFWSNREHTDTQFIDALQHKPAIVMVVYHDEHQKPFDPKRDLYLPRVDLLKASGYQLSRVFCGEIPEGFVTREQTCNLIFERPK